jgi:hypothetical protein
MDAARFIGDLESQMRKPFLIFVVLQILDFATTWVAIRLGGSEHNPLVSQFMAFGPVIGLLVTKIIVIGMASLGVWMGKQNGIRWANVAFSFVIAWNLSIITRLALLA